MQEWTIRCYYFLPSILDWNLGQIDARLNHSLFSHITTSNYYCCNMYTCWLNLLHRGAVRHVKFRLSRLFSLCLLWTHTSFPALEFHSFKGRLFCKQGDAEKTIDNEKPLQEEATFSFWWSIRTLVWKIRRMKIYFS